MKKYFIIQLFSFCFLLSSKAQMNLVPNESFEITDTCMNDLLIMHAIPWYNPTQMTPDYYNNNCATPGYSGVPSNFCGYQYARTGVAYAGICVYGSSIDYPSIREYIQVELLEALTQNNQYCVKFYVSNTRKPSTPYNVAISKLGLLFSTNSIIMSTMTTINATPQITSPDGIFLSDSVNWTEISGIYEALGGEKYITIGNFNIDANTDTIDFNNSASQHGAYYYIDDVSIIDCTNLSIMELNNSNIFSISSNPFSLHTIISFIKEQINTTIKILDIQGKEIEIINFSGRQLTIDKGEKKAGIYFLQTIDKNNIVTTDKIIIQ
jgi:hypothetical protein